VPLEARISEILWRWRFTDRGSREQLLSDSELPSLLEYWFPFHEIPYTRKLGTWCDGIALLTVKDLSRTAFTVYGAGYFPYAFSPFSLDFHYRNRRDLLTTRIVLRFGFAGRDGGLHTFRNNVSYREVLSKWPRDIHEWAVAVELTPQ